MYAVRAWSAIMVVVVRTTASRRYAAGMHEPRINVKSPLFSDRVCKAGAVAGRAQLCFRKSQGILDCHMFRRLRPLSCRSRRCPFPRSYIPYRFLQLQLRAMQ
jgi:hypothetical protein